MPERPECRIIVEPAPGYKVRLRLFDPLSLRLTQVLETAGPSQRDIDRAINKLKDRLEQTGSHATVKEM